MTRAMTLASRCASGIVSCLDMWPPPLRGPIMLSASRYSHGPASRGSQIVMHGHREDYPAVAPAIRRMPKSGRFGTTIRKLHNFCRRGPVADIPSRIVLRWAIQGREHGHRADLNGEM